MIDKRNLRRLVLPMTLVVALASANFQASGQTTAPQSTIVENSKPLPRPPARTLGTKAYESTAQEKTFFAKLAEGEQTTGSMLREYSITGKQGKYVGWFGIVRKVEEDKTARQTKLLIEMKYFDGLTDTHIQALSWNGAGDFAATLNGVDLGIQALSLVKAYGSVTGETSAVPEVRAEYVRQWDWGLFTFLMPYGKQNGNTEWKKLSKVTGGRIYNPFPSEKYYEDLLGPREK